MRRAARSVCFAPERLRKLNGPAVEERVLLVDDGWKFCEHDRYGVETNLAPFDSGARGISPRGADNILLFFVADSAIGATELCRCAGLDFDEHEYPIVSGDKIYFRVARVGPVVPGKNS